MLVVVELIHFNSTCTIMFNLHKFTQFPEVFKRQLGIFFFFLVKYCSFVQPTAEQFACFARTFAIANWPAYCCPNMAAP